MSAAVAGGKIRPLAGTHDMTKRQVHGDESKKRKGGTMPLANKQLAAPKHTCMIVCWGAFLKMIRRTYECPSLRDQTEKTMGWDGLTFSCELVLFGNLDQPVH